jgi:Trk-type K+ transport system membrane component
MAMIEFIIGGIGFPLIFDLIEKFKYKRKGLKYQLSLFTKLGLLGFGTVSIIGLIFAFSFEYAFTVHSYGGYNDIVHYVCSHNEFGKNEQFNKAWAIFFNAMSTRSAGLATINQNALSPGMQ